jgi:hypothetical protein
MDAGARIKEAAPPGGLLRFMTRHIGLPGEGHGKTFPPLVARLCAVLLNFILVAAARRRRDACNVPLGGSVSAEVKTQMLLICPAGAVPEPISVGD